MLVTPLRDGMNLVAKEYVACRIDDDGALVLSEFAGAAVELDGAFLVNPHDADGVKRGDPRRDRARTRPSSSGGCAACARSVEAYDVDRWAKSFLAALAEPEQGR